MEEIKGYVEHIVYRNEDNGYTVFNLNNDDGDLTCVGKFHYIEEGELLELTGEYIVHKVYGTQLQVETSKVCQPEDKVSIERYLGSGAIKGVGPSLAGRIVKKFGGDTFRIIEEEPERLAEVKGISERKAREIAIQVEEKKDMREAMIYLQKYGISTTLAARIYQHYGQSVYRVIEENPYQMADHVPGVGFKTADEIASKVGIHTDSDYRIKAGILYVLLQASANGHTYLPKSRLFEQASERFKGGARNHGQAPDGYADRPQSSGKNSPRQRTAGISGLFFPLLLSGTEHGPMLHDLNIRGDIPETEIRANLAKVQKKEEIHLDELQEKAVFEAVNSGLLVITGGPGTGKTTTINAIIQYFENEGMEILLAAPTGRAAKRMTETTGYEARTIHRMLELVPSGIPDSGSMSGNNAPSGKNGSFSSGGMHFDRNEENPLDADVIIIDEMSMVDLTLMHALLTAVVPGTRLILVGDVNQLPSVGPGSVLKDTIASNKFHVVTLTKIFRQAGESDIVLNAHKINAGECVIINNKSRDFFFLKRQEADVIIGVVITLIQKKLTEICGCISV